LAALMKTLFGSIEARIPSQRLASCKVPHSDFGVLAPFRHSAVSFDHFVAWSY
jgi:hypothetical protein